MHLTFTILFICPHVTTQELRKKFLFNLVFKCCNKICRHITMSVNWRCKCAILETCVKYIERYHISFHFKWLPWLCFYMTLISPSGICWHFSIKCTLLRIIFSSTYAAMFTSLLALYTGQAQKKFTLSKWYRKHYITRITSHLHWRVQEILNFALNDPSDCCTFFPPVVSMATP